jgi:DNA-directed RNA polymerase specialized sigma24 family protein
MPHDGSTSLWVGRLRDGRDEDAVHRLWEAYFHRLVRLARAKLRGVRRRAADEEDVALSAFDSFCRGAARGRFPQLNTPDDLWRLLVTITARKACDLTDRQRRAKRGGGHVRGDSAVVAPAAGGWEAVAGREPTPAFAAQTAEEYRRLLGLLGDDELRAIAVRKMEGYTNEEIAAERGCAVPTVERRLRLIRKTWSAQLAAADGPTAPGPP